MIKNTDSISIKKRKNLLNEIDSMHPVDKKIALRKFEFENQTSSQSDNFKNECYYKKHTRTISWK